MKVMTYSKLGLALIVAFIATGCQSATEAVCEQAAMCQGKGEIDEEICVVAAEAQEEIADLRACSELFERYYDCIEETTNCQNGQLVIDQACQEDQDRVADCFDGIVSPPLK